MPVIAFSSPKGGAGKTTAATLVATELALLNASVTIIDADPNRNVVDWAKLPGLPDTLRVIGDVGEDTIAEAIEAAAGTSTFVIIDLEGTASLLVSYAVAMSDLVVIPVQGSQLDAKQAARQIKLIKGQEKVLRRPIPRPPHPDEPRDHAEDGAPYRPALRRAGRSRLQRPPL